MVLDIVVHKSDDGFTAEVPSLKDVKLGRMMKIL